MNKLKWLYAVLINLFSLKKQNRAYALWLLQKGDKTLRLDYSLSQDSIVFDLGGYKGDFANDIYQRYGSFVYIFEPVKEYFEQILNRFDGNKKIKIYNYGLGSQDREEKIYIAGDSSSTIIKKADSAEDIAIIKAESVFTEIDKIDLMKINIEGGEYELMYYILEENLQTKVVNFQIQFHSFVKDSKEMRAEIRNMLSATHYLTYDYEFIWENWKLK